jgi:acetoin utilization protein AcuA
LIPNRFEFETPKGPVDFEGPVNGPYIESLEINQNLNNFRPARIQKKALINIAGLPDGMIFIARYRNEIIGYITFHKADEYTRWSRHPKVLEMGGIEISPDWRQCKVGENLLKVAFMNKNLEDFIVITMEYCWHWDLRNSNLDVWDYQRMLTKLFARVGLNKTTTDDPDIIEHPANVLMSRIGKNISQEDIMLFESLRFLSNNKEHKNVL